MDHTRSDRVLLLRSALVARARGETPEEWLSYEAALPNSQFYRVGIHVAALVWDGFLDDSVFDDAAVWDDALIA